MKKKLKRTTDPTQVDFHNMFRLDDRVVVITGGMGLIGKAFTEICAQYGANVVILDIPNTKPEEYAIELEVRFSRKMLGISIDVSKRIEVKRSLDIILGKFNKVSDLVNCHHNKSKSFFTKFEDYKDEE